MKRLEPEIVDYYDNEVVMMLVEKYALSQMDALKSFVSSKTHEMLENEDCGMIDFGAKAIFEKWECEKIYDNYRIYHTERIENAYMDIDSLMQTGKSAW